MYMEPSENPGSGSYVSQHIKHAAGMAVDFQLQASCLKILHLWQREMRSTNNGERGAAVVSGN